MTLPLHSSPDNGYDPTNQAAITPDLGELAARLNSPDKFNRQGRVIYMDQFDIAALDGSPLAWYFLSGGSGTGQMARITGLYGYSLSPGIGVTIWAPNANGNYSKIRKYIPTIKIGTYGIEVIAYFPQIGGSFEWHLNLNKNGITYLAWGKVAIATGAYPLAYYYAPAGWVGISNFLPAAYANFQTYPHYIKMTCDLANGIYKSLAVDSYKVDLSSYSLVQSGSGQYGLMSVELQENNDNAGAVNPFLEITNLILTTDEPT